MASQTRVVFRLALAWILWACAGSAVALDPALDISQYAHTAWKIRDGFAKGPVTAFAQTPDGYLWLGTEFGLLRFDGVRNVPWQPPAGMSLPDRWVRSLLVARDGTLWIGTWRGLASWNGSNLVTYPRFDGSSINALAEGHDGTVWVGGDTQHVGLLCAIRGGSTECDAEDGSLTGINSLYEDSNGALWVALANRLWRWKPGPPVPYSLPGNIPGLRALSETASGEILIVTAQGVQRVVDGNVKPFPPLFTSRHLRPIQPFRDRDGAIWVGTQDGGLLHLHQGHLDVFGHTDGLSGDLIIGLFEDREGNVWVATADGVDRFRPSPAVTYSTKQGVQGVGASVLADQDGSIWLSTGRGLYRWRDARISAYRARGTNPVAASGDAGEAPTTDQLAVTGLPGVEGSLFQDSRGRLWLASPSGFGYLEDGRFVSVSGVPAGYIDGIAEDRERYLWIAHRNAGLLRLSPELKVIQQIPWTSIGQSARYRLAVDPVHAGLWVGFASGGIVHLIDGQVRASYSVREGLGKGSVNDLRVGADGTIWAATDGGLSRLKDGRIATLNKNSGLPCDLVDSTIDGGDTSVWLYTECGLLRVERADLDTLAVAVEQAKAPQRIRTMVLDSSDGVSGVGSHSSFTPHIAKGRDGKIWFKTADGVTVVDPRNLHINNLPPPVRVERAVADRKTYEASGELRLPPLVRDLQIDYTALSLVAPEKNRFRYRLEGRDTDWQDAGNRRQAFYTDLDPGQYRFRVIASNNSGVWNEQGATLDFSIAPAYWQTNWFRALCVAALVAVLWALYRLRVHQLARQFNLTLETRVNERTRIARDLHDTLLQSFHGLLLRFQTAKDLLPHRAAEAEQVLGSAIDQAAEAITEGRDAVQGLRASTVEGNELGAAIRALGDELAAEQGGGDVTLGVEVQGTPHNLHPIVRDEVFRIAGEALRNAFRHAQAKEIEVELRYDERSLSLRVRDDGKGIDAEVLSLGGREGHFGLSGMRERARQVGGKLTVWSGLGDGTEVELSIPASRAYAASPADTTWRMRLARRLQGEIEPGGP